MALGSDGFDFWNLGCAAFVIVVLVVVVEAMTSKNGFFVSHYQRFCLSFKQSLDTLVCLLLDLTVHILTSAIWNISFQFVS